MPSRNQFNTQEEYNEWYRRYRAAHRVKLRKYNRKYNTVWRKEHGYHNEIASQIRYPDKERARQLLRSAVRGGKIAKQPCLACGQKSPVQGHHEDYTQPFVVIWLCALCHTQWHIQNRKM